MFKTIVVGLDGSEGAANALRFAEALARRDEASLVLAHVEQDVIGKGGGPIRATETEIQDAIDDRAEELRAGGIGTRVEKSTVFLGGPGAAIAKIADDAGADLIVVGTRGHSSAAGILLGSVAQRLLHLAKQAVLVVPEQAEASTG